MHTYDFFVSYTKNDKAEADWIVFHLEAAGYTCVFQARDFVPGESFMEQMRDASAKSKTTIAVLSPDYLKSDFAQMELDGALALDPRGTKGRLLPVQVRKCTLDPLMKTRVYIDLTKCSEDEAVETLVSGVKAFRTGMRNSREGYFSAVPSFTERRAPEEPATEQLDKPTELRLAFLASDAGIQGLGFKQEAEYIRNLIPEQKRKLITVESVFDIEAGSFYSSLNRINPHIVHFSGSFLGSGDLALNDGKGGYQKIDLDAAVAMFRCFRDQVKLIVLNACHSLECAKRLPGIVDAAIGIEGLINDPDAILFSRTFYDALWNGRSIYNAYEQATTRLHAEGVSDEAIPKLLSAEGKESSILAV